MFDSDWLTLIFTKIGKKFLGVREFKKVEKTSWPSSLVIRVEPCFGWNVHRRTLLSFCHTLLWLAFDFPARRRHPAQCALLNSAARFSQKQELRETARCDRPHQWWDKILQKGMSRMSSCQNSDFAQNGHARSKSQQRDCESGAVLDVGSKSDSRHDFSNRLYEKYFSFKVFRRM